jgi:rfaE bifunctional protein nucleotidyltransferase chain/domain
MHSIPDSLSQKIISRQQIDRDGWVGTRPLVFTNGVFDLLHRGHVVYLASACRLGASMLVAVNTDDSVRRLGKGPRRPLNTESDRALVIAGLTSVSFVTFFDETTPCELISKCRPDIYVKGGDYDMETLEETRLVRSWGGRAQAIPFVPGYSSTAVLNSLSARSDARGGDS